MTFTYDAGGSFTTTLSQIRLEIGDTNSNDPFLTDEEIAYVTGAEGDFWSQCAKCCELIAAKVARDVDHRWGSSYEASSKIASNYLDMAKKFARKSSASYPWSQSIDVDSKLDNEEDTDIVQPLFKRGMHDNT